MAACCAQQAMLGAAPGLSTRAVDCALCVMHPWQRGPVLLTVLGSASQSCRCYALAAVQTGW